MNPGDQSDAIEQYLIQKGGGDNMRKVSTDAYKAALRIATIAAKGGTCHFCNLPFTDLIGHYKAAHPKVQKCKTCFGTGDYRSFKGAPIVKCPRCKGTGAEPRLSPSEAGPTLPSENKKE